MKKILFVVLSFLSLNASAQNYDDSTITIQMPRCFAWWITKAISENINRDNYRMLSIVPPFLGTSATKPDSLFTASIKAKYVIAGLELLITRASALTIVDRLKIINNQKIGAIGLAIAGYTSLETQIVQKSNGNSVEKLVATYIKEWYLRQNERFAETYTDEVNILIELVKPD